MVIKLVEVTGVVRGLGSAWGGYVDYWGDLIGGGYRGEWWLGKVSVVCRG